MFKNANEVAEATNEEILAIVSESWRAVLSDILDKDSLDVFKKAREVEEEAEKIAFAIRERYNSIVEEIEKSDEDDDYDEYEIDVFMNSIASCLGQCYNSEYTRRPDYFWKPSTC